MNFCFISNLSLKNTTTKTNPIQSNKFNTEFDQIGILPSQQWRELHLQVIQEVDLYLLVRQPTWLGLPLRWNHFSMTSWQFTWFLVKYYPLSDLWEEKSQGSLQSALPLPGVNCPSVRAQLSSQGSLSLSLSTLVVRSLPPPGLRLTDWSPGFINLINSTSPVSRWTTDCCLLQNIN